MPPTLPESIRVGYRDYTVEVLDPALGEAENIYGRHSTFLTRIEVRTDLAPFEQADTLIHEVLHALWQMADLPRKDEEKAVTLLSRGLTQVIRDNPALMVFLDQSLTR